MTNEQLEQLAQLIADKIADRFDKLWEDEPPIQESYHQLDRFGNIKNVSPKEVLYMQLQQLDEQREKLLTNEKYELLIELEEIYEKIKKEHDRL
tara:strand:- start:8259 stop:8540 length:282 start_codon:yes stop_codon:yes gene_type:complete